MNAFQRMEQAYKTAKVEIEFWKDQCGKDKVELSNEIRQLKSKLWNCENEKNTK